MNSIFKMSFLVILSFTVSLWIGSSPFIHSQSMPPPCIHFIKLLRNLLSYPWLSFFVTLTPPKSILRSGYVLHWPTSLHLHCCQINHLPTHHSIFRILKCLLIGCASFCALSTQAFFHQVTRVFFWKCKSDYAIPRNQTFKWFHFIITIKSTFCT